MVSTIPWDAYLIRSNIWSYPPDVVLGPTLFEIPVEEIFFFVIQTYNTSLLYLIASKPILKEVYLVNESSDSKIRAKWKYIKMAGQLAVALVAKNAIGFVREEGSKTYLGLILIWALPFLWLLWGLAYQFLVQLPLPTTILPILLPTIYLWVVDTVAMNRGTWVIESGTKTGATIWPGLEVEEALFFFLTNCLIVFGLVAFDNAVAVLNAFPAHFPEVPTLPSPVLLVRALLFPASAYDEDRIRGLQQSVARLKSRSRSFYLASSTFQGRLRLDLILLYSFCRVADDLIDNATTPVEAWLWLQKLKQFLDLSYGDAVVQPDGTVVKPTDPNRGAATLYMVQNFPPEFHLTLLFLPTQNLDKDPLYELLKGFEMDIAFSDAKHGNPIKSEDDLDLYGARVAGTVARLCIQLVIFHYPEVPRSSAKRLMFAGHNMGIALQYTNIARDLGVDARIGRCYVPPPWLKKEKLTPGYFLLRLQNWDSEAAETKPDDFFFKKVEIMQKRLLDRAFAFYGYSVGVIEELPEPARAPIRVAVESYMQIGRELRQRRLYKFQPGRASVPLWKRVVIAWWALLGPVSRETPSS